MGKVKEFLKTEWGFIFMVIFLGLLISLIPTIYELVNRNNIFPGREFELIYSYTWDYHAYLSKIIQGIKGKWLVSENFTSEVHNPSLLQIFYLLLGKFGSIFSSNPVFSYQMGRIIFGILWAVAGYFFIKLCFPKKILLRKLAFLLFIFSGNMPKIVTDPNAYGFSFLGVKWELYLSGWSHMLPANRMAFVPHWNAGHLFTVLTFIFLWKWIGSKKLKWGMFAGVCSLINGFILPPGLIVNLAVVAIYTTYIIVNSLLKKQRIGELFYSYLTVIPFWIMSFIPLIYNLWVTGFYPWKSLVENDLYLNRIIFPYETYFISLGITFYLGFLGFLLIILKKEKKLFFPWAWVFTSIFLIVIFDKFIVWHNQTRFVQVGIELPLAILTIYFLDFILTFFKKIKSSLLVIFTILILIPSILSWVITISGRIDFVKQKAWSSYPSISMGPYEVYPVKEVMESLKFIDRYGDEGEVVFSGPAYGNYLAAYTNKKAFAGHTAQTVLYFNEKLPLVTKFYKKELTGKEIKGMFRKYNIRYVVLGPEEKENWKSEMKENEYLKKIFSRGLLTIYQVR